MDFQFKKEEKYLTAEVKIGIKYGIYPTSAALIIRTIQKYNRDVFLEKEGNRVNAKSIMSLLALEAFEGSNVKILVEEGEGAEKLLERLKKGLETKTEGYPDFS